jgi:hypothetical protein
MRWFAFLLCRTVRTGYGLDVDCLLTETPSKLLAEWRTLYELEPWDAERSDYAMGTAIMHTVAAHGIAPKLPNEYMSFLQKAEPKPQKEADMKATWEAICRIMG